MAERRTTKGEKFYISNSYGMYDAYLEYKRNRKNHVKREQFSKIVQAVNAKFISELLVSGTLTFPEGLGELFVCGRKMQPVRFSPDGKMTILSPINWYATRKLWDSDPQAKTDKLLIRYDSDFVYKLMYSTKNANYTNKLFFKFKTNTFLRRRISSVLKNKSIPTYESFIK